MTNYVWKEGEDPETNYRSFMNGKQATFNLATNPKNYVVNNGQESIIPPMRTFLPYIIGHDIIISGVHVECCCYFIVNLEIILIKSKQHSI